MFSLVYGFSSESDIKLCAENINNRFIDSHHLQPNVTANQIICLIKVMTVKYGEKLDKLYNVLIAQNRKNIKMNNNFTTSDDDKKIYKQRSKIENFFATYNPYRILETMNSKTIESYNGLFMLASCYNLYRKIEKIKNEIAEKEKN